MQIEYHPTRNQQKALYYLSLDKKQRKKLDIETPGRTTLMNMWRDGVLGAYWRSGRSGWYRKFFLPDDIKSQMNASNTPESIVIDIDDNDRYAVLDSAAKLWEGNKTVSIEKQFSRIVCNPGGSYYDRYKTKTEKYQVKVVPDFSISKDTGLSLETVRDSIKWLDRRGFLIRVLESDTDADSYAQEAIDRIDGYHKGKRDIPWVEEQEPYLPEHMPERVRRGFIKLCGDTKLDKPSYTLAKNNAEVRYRLEIDDPGFFDFLGDVIRLDVEAELMKRAVRRVEEDIARWGDYSKRDLSRYGWHDHDLCFLCDFKEAFFREKQIFESRAACAFLADTDESMLPVDILRRLTIQTLEESSIIGARFTPLRYRRIKELSEKNNASVSNDTIENTENQEIISH
ncbi:MAG: hypothetical protein PHU12_00030 [Candidatus Aenigmarchaeota archaeon]|nr:hypothetical protein [Candidatus Aenigmarchaeota archaeon]